MSARETGLYYLQSRYYNPTWGRFLNADVFVATGQGLLGNNMFAYCNNNPVNSADPSGKFPDSYAGWVGQEIGELIFEAITGEEHPNDKADELDAQIRAKQILMLKKGLRTVWNAYQHNLELEMQNQYEKDMTVIAVTDFLMENPLVAIDVVTGTVGTGLSYVGIGTAIAGISIPVAGQVAMGIVGTICGIWGLYRLGTLIYDSI